MCGKCREYVSALEEAGGQMLAEIAPVAMAPGAAAHVMSLLDRETDAPSVQARKQSVMPVWQPEQKRCSAMSSAPGAGRARLASSRR